MVFNNQYSAEYIKGPTGWGKMGFTGDFGQKEVNDSIMFSEHSAAPF
jgi:hypothetical protein